MSEETCQDCGAPLSEHPQVHDDSSVDYWASMMIADAFPGDVAEPLRRVLTDWRTHAIPACHPLALR